MRDANIQQGNNNKMTVDNSSSRSDGWLKGIGIAVIAGIIILIIGAIFFGIGNFNKQF